MITRTTNQTLARSAQQNLQANMSRMAKLQEQVSSSTAITRPSDNPAGTADALKVRAEIRANAQYSSNISDADGWLTTVDSALDNTTDLLRRIKDLALRGASAGLSPANKDAVASELEGLKQDLLKEANTTFAGRNVFAGNSDAKGAFTVEGSEYVHHGTGTGVMRRVDGGAPVRVDADGAAVFGTGPASVFALVDSLAKDLRSGADLTEHLVAIDARANTVLSRHTEVGVRHAGVLKARDTNLDQTVSLEARRSGIEDLDTAKVILDLKLQELSYQTALSVTARALQPTLMDFLR
ncbi:flagellar hook-associated protein FlgL [Arthrobacter sp. ATA002]|uniref:flagellar hook-associated protein FlgL n=1 Tax=Arthrobacter sp. ATA002 TaxID=2991715 RepID=UPI0022A76566|nr:flagellar hook-associated protein FlgL [Arthrobacter sp. ATA002]WAP51681.1 flagellar hook-associated protein FlgL [Arthrobacter sp. ATA002]